MKEAVTRKYEVQMSFEEIRLPPFQDILILGKKCPQGKIGINKSFDLLVPNEFEVLEVDDPIIEAVFVNKRILKKMDRNKILNILAERVFPYVSERELLRVSFKLKVYYESIEIDFN